jgi:hypothetical protein
VQGNSSIRSFFSNTLYIYMCICDPAPFGGPLFLPSTVVVEDAGKEVSAAEIVVAGQRPAYLDEPSQPTSSSTGAREDGKLPTC